MVAVAGSLAVSLTVTTTQRAEASPVIAVLPVVAAAEAALGGGVAISMPSLLATSLAVHPVGWGIAAAIAIGVGLYATKDYWLPYVNGDYGKGNGNIDYGTSGSTYAENVVVNSSSVAANGVDAIATFTYTATGSTTGWTFGAQAIFKCQRVSDGKIFWKLASITSSQPNRTTSWTRSYTMIGCTAGGAYKMLGWMVGGGYNPTGEIFTPNIDGTQNTIQFSGNSSSGTGQHGPKNIMRFGDLQTEGFDPKSPDTKYRAEVECVAADGTKSLISAVTPGDVGAIRMPSCEAAGKGHGTGAYKIYGTPPGTTIEGTEPLETQAAPTADPSRPLCDPNKGGAPCKLGVMLDGKPCTIGAFECQNWSSLTNDPNWSTRLSCQYGIYAVPMASCNPLERAYEPGGAPATDANTDGNPNTRSDTNATGQPQPKPDTSTGTAPGGFPSSGTNGNPDDPCLKDAWSWTPADWVKNPVVCALKDAFVPKTDIQARSNALRQKSLDTVPISWLSAPLVGPGGGGCPNWTINVAGMSKNVICDSSFTAALVGVRVPLFGLVAAAMVWPLIRGIWYAAIPVLRVSPGSSK